MTDTASQSKPRLLIVYDTYELPNVRKFKREEAKGVRDALRAEGYEAKAINIDDLQLQDDGSITCKGRAFDVSHYDGVWWRTANRVDRSGIPHRKPDNRPLAEAIEAQVSPFTPFSRMVEADSKVLSQAVFEQHDLPTPLTIALHENQPEQEAEQQLDAFLDKLPPGPIVIKRDRGQGGYGRKMVASKEEARQVALKWRKTAPENNGVGVVVQQMIAGPLVRVEVAVSDDEAHIFSAKEQYQSGSAQGDLALQVAETFGPGVWGVDMMGIPPRVLEANPLSSMSEFEMRQNPQDNLYVDSAKVFADTIAGRMQKGRPEGVLETAAHCGTVHAERACERV